jgi:NADPH:quinone reductase-like Zn-dependent oxidoreductase
MESGQMKSVIDSRFGLDEVPEAVGHSEEGHARGKIIVTVE